MGRMARSGDGKGRDILAHTPFLREERDALMPEAIIVGSDHAGFALKQKVKAHLEARGFAVEDVGIASEQFVDYPKIAHELAEAVADGRFARGVVICGTGLGVSMAANRHAGVRAAVAYDLRHGAPVARAQRRERPGARRPQPGPRAGARRILDVWLDTAFEGGRHARRVALIEPGAQHPPPSTR